MWLKLLDFQCFLALSDVIKVNMDQPIMEFAQPFKFNLRPSSAKSNHVLVLQSNFLLNN